jgi:group II intron reverse transcriptase/maturase
MVTNNYRQFWKNIPWRKLRQNLFRLQCRLFKAIREDDKLRAKRLQKLILKSRSARLLAIRQVTQLNAGKKTAGADGKAKLSFKERIELDETLWKHYRNWKHQGLKEFPIPKKDGTTRILKVPTIADRAWQCLIKYAIEPAHEALFHARSYGFRPGRGAHDAQKLLFDNLKSTVKGIDKRILELDIEKCFDSIHHQILMKLLAQRIADQRFLKLVERFLKAGIMEGRLFKRTETGTPQGAICSPILANIYLHQLDLYWWNKYGNLHRKEKERRRNKHMGNCALIRYADDWLLLTNGGKAEAIRLKEEFKTFLWEELKLELSPEKTRITHVNQGFDFLGFHVQRYVKSNDRPKMLVTPAQENIKKLKLKVKEMTRRKWFQDSPQLKISALNAVLRGWINVSSQ